MSLWAVFLTGLLAGGASCAVVQGGLLAGAVGRRRPEAPAPSGGGADALPVAGFLAGKLVTHTAFGALLGLVGDAVQPGFRTRAVLQVVAGLAMVLIAADLLGVAAVRRLFPRPPASWGRLVRRSGRVGGALGPALLGGATILVPCGVTLGMELLAVASGSALAGAAVMATFVVGTTPLFATLGYAARRSGIALRGRLGFLAGAAVLVAGLLAVNSGLVTAGSPVTLASAWQRLSQPADRGPVVTAPIAVEPDGVQRIAITVRERGYSPSRVAVKAGVPTELVLRTQGELGCTSAFVVPRLGIERILEEEGDTVVALGRLPAGTLRFTCSMGMYGGTIEVRS